MADPGFTWNDFRLIQMLAREAEVRAEESPDHAKTLRSRALALRVIADRIASRLPPENTHG